MIIPRFATLALVSSTASTLILLASLAGCGSKTDHGAALPACKGPGCGTGIGGGGGGGGGSDASSDATSDAATDATDASEGGSGDAESETDAGAGG